MLLTEPAEHLLPDWAFFVRSRESLYEDETPAALREALGERIRSWLTGLAAVPRSGRHGNGAVVQAQWWRATA